MTQGSDVLGLTTGLFGSACFACFTWGTVRHFARVEKQSGGAWAISLLSLVVFMLFLVRLAVWGVSTAWPLQWMLFGASVGLWVWSIRATAPRPPSLAFTGDLPVLLMSGGPYRLIRHPFYTSYLTFWAATALPARGSLGAELAGAAAFLVMAGAYLIAARYEERKFARSALAKTYLRYAAGTGMFLPRLHAGPAADQSEETLH